VLAQAELEGQVNGSVIGRSGRAVLCQVVARCRLLIVPYDMFKFKFDHLN
jgi:hypothetical protein